MKVYAVITGDIIGFTKVAPQYRQELVHKVEALIQSWVEDKADAQIFRGDSYQLVLSRPDMALRRSIQLICWFKMHLPGAELHLATRISIGVGTIAYKGTTVLSSEGEAFHLSGRNFDLLGNEEYLGVYTSDEDKNKAFKIILIFINKYISNWTRGQAEVLFWLLEGKTQQEIADMLSVSQPSVNSRLKLSGWRELEPAIEYISTVIDKT